MHRKLGDLQLFPILIVYLKTIHITCIKFDFINLKWIFFIWLPDNSLLLLWSNVIIILTKNILKIYSGKKLYILVNMLPMSKQASGGFSIDSIINTTRRETSREDSPLSRNNVDNPRPNLGTRCELSAINGRIPPLHPALPIHVRNLLLAGETTRSLPQDVFHYGQSWPLHNSSLPSISTLARSLPQYIEPCLNAGFSGLWPQVSDQMAFLNPWLVTRGTQSLLGLPLGMLFVFFSFRDIFWDSA